MRSWSAPQLEELDVRLTAKEPGYEEREEITVGDYVLIATWNVFEKDTPSPYPCLPPKEAPAS